MLSQQQQVPIIYIHNNRQQPAKCHQCIQIKLGQFVNIQWNIKNGRMKLFNNITIDKNHPNNQNNLKQLQKSKSNRMQYTKYENKGEDIQLIKNAFFYHGSNCPLLRQGIIGNIDKYMKPCACVMLFDPNTQQFLVTQRSPNLRTFPNSWVLPGGHLQKQQGIFQGGIRQCQEEVGLPLHFKPKYPIQQNIVMLWQSVFTTDQHVKACAVVVFFVVYCQKFEVKIDDKQVSAYKWKSIHNNSDEKRYDSNTKTGYAQGHLKFLQIVRKNMKFKNSK